MRYYYFVTYVMDSDDGSYAVGNSEVETDQPIQTFEHIASIQGKLAESRKTQFPNAKNVILTSYTLLRQS